MERNNDKPFGDRRFELFPYQRPNRFGELSLRDCLNVEETFSSMVRGRLKESGIVAMILKKVLYGMLH